jgi:hypothetical protein
MSWARDWRCEVASFHIPGGNAPTFSNYLSPHNALDFILFSEQSSQFIQISRIKDGHLSPNHGSRFRFDGHKDFFWSARRHDTTSDDHLVRVTFLSL